MAWKTFKDGWVVKVVRQGYEPAYVMPNNSAVFTRVKAEEKAEALRRIGGEVTLVRGRVQIYEAGD